MREMKTKVRNGGGRLKINAISWTVVACLFADDTVLFAKNEEELQRVVDEFYGVCTRGKLKVNAG